jgi:beta-N-acetylhexosaminidase
VRLPSDPVRRRRLAVLAAVAGGAAFTGAAVGSDGGREQAERPAGETQRRADSRPPARPGPGAALRPPTASAATGGPSTERLVREAGQTIVLRFKGTAVPAYVLRALRERRVAGVILFRDNMRSPAQLRAMTRAIQRAGRGRALVMTDQEGGAIRNVPWASPVSAPPGLRSAAVASAAGRAAARDLRAAGVNVNLAPVADVGTWPGSVMRRRAFPGASAQVGALVAASVRGHRAGGVLPTAKHFPGLGRSTTNTDFRPATVAGRGDLGPFAAAIGAGVPLVMASHALHPELDRSRIASQSSRILTTLLRGRLRFQGVCITDSLEAQAVVRRSSTPVAAARSMRAGCDILLTTGPASYLQVLRRLVADARADPRFRARLSEARGRIARLDR